MKRTAKVLAAAIATMTIFPVKSIVAANSYVPELNIYVQGSHPKIEIGIDMASEDVVLESNMASPAPSLIWNGRGTQSLTTYDGRNVLMMTDSITGKSGNYYSYPDTESENNYSDFSYMKYPRDTWFSVSYEVKAISSNNHISFGARAGHRSKGYPTYDNSGNQVYWSQSTNLSGSTSSSIYKVKLADGSAPNFNDGQTVVLVSSDDTNWGFYYIYFTYSASNRGFKFDKSGSGAEYGIGTYSTRKYTTFASGSAVLSLNSYPVQSNFQNRNIPADGQWHRVSSNSQISSIDWDTNINGFKPSFYWGSNNNMYISNMKFGKASRVQIMRDDSTIVYDDYGSDYLDTTITSKPAAASVTGASTGSTTVDFTFNAPNTSETHYYKSRSLGSDSNTPSNWSQNYAITVGSSTQGYSVVVDSNAGTDPGTSMNNTTGRFSTSGYKRGDTIYCHVRSVDQNGNWSAPMHYRYTVQQTAQDLKADINELNNKLHIDNTTDVSSINSQLLALRTNGNITYSINSSNRVNGTKYTDGSWTGIASINGSSVVINRKIDRRAEYQTKEELKNDITDYLGQTSYNLSKSIPDKVPYSYSKDTEKLKHDILAKCKTNNSLGDVSVTLVENTASEKTSGKLKYEVTIN